MSRYTQNSMSVQDTSTKLTMEEVYNLLMQQIEPELMTDMLPKLESLYPNETPQEWKQRQERYKKAFAVYEERFMQIMHQWKQDIVAARDALVSASKA